MEQGGTLAARQRTRQVDVGGVTLGGGAPVRVQSMLTAPTADAGGALAQTRALAQVEHLKAEGVNPFNLKKEIGERKEKMKPVQHKAVGAKVTYNHAYNRYYPAAGEQTLVDGNMGGWAHGDGRWQGFIGKDCFDVTIDLGKSTKISSVGTDFMQSSGPEIFYPSQYPVSVSEDGKNFTQVFDKKYESSKEPILNFKTLTWKGSKTARYIRVQAKPSSFGGWLFVDEIIVK